MAHKFFGVQFSGESFYKSYQLGLSGSQCQRPQYVKELEKDALKKGRSISKKALKMLEEKNCSGEFSFISQDEQQKIISILEKESPPSKMKSLKLIHACSRLKSHGGSAGEKRYVLFDGDVDALWVEIAGRYAAAEASGALDERRRGQVRDALWENIRAGLLREFCADPRVVAALPGELDGLLARGAVPGAAARRLLRLFRSGGLE
jgi:hypothetical protein